MLNPSGTNAGAYVETISFQPAGIGPSVLASQTQPAIRNAGRITNATKYKAAMIGCSDVRPNFVSSDCSHDCTGKTIPPAFAKAAKTSRKTKAATSKRLKNLFRRFLLRSILTNWLPGKEASSDTFSCGQAWTQSRQRVQSMLLVLRGWNNCNSHPRCCSFPRIQSNVWHVLQTARLRTETS